VSTLPSRERRSDDRDTYVFELSVESDLSDCSDRGFKLIIQGSRSTHRIFSPMYVPLSTKRPAVHRWSTLLPVALLWRMEAIYLRVTKELGGLMRGHVGPGRLAEHLSKTKKCLL
jgi:hypothetical protein